jgi:uncharacterized protein YdaU (DUF1376 family)
MNYYPFNLGDYALHTRHLSLMEDLAYRRMLDLYYTTEGPLPDARKTARLIGMPEHVAEVESVLGDFFSTDGERWLHKRCEEEIAKYRDKHDKARASGKASASVRATNAQRTLNEHSTVVQLTKNQEPRTKNQEPEEKEIPARKRAAAARLVSVDSLVADGVDRQNAEDWLTARKAKGLPLTPTAWQQTKDEAVKAGLSAAEAIKAAAGNGWAGFKAAWMLSDHVRAPPQGVNKQSALEARNAATVKRLLAEDHATQ